MGLLGMLVAGGAMGARDASNQNVQAQNQLEIENARESIRQQFYDRRYQQKRSDNLEMAKSQALLDERNYHRDREDKISDRDAKHQLEMAKIGANLKGKMAIEDRRDKRALLRTNAGSAEDGGFGKMSSPAGKAAVDLMNLGIVDKNDPNGAYQMAVRLDIVKAAQQNPMVKIDDNALLESVQRLSDGLFPGGSAKAQDPSAQNILKYNPKTGGF